ncbi:glycoside hydrolase superfamily [Obelidium mucronatum]|nr:glycoside hydrolase superfamily [Obelidium mucronatum]
MAVILLLVLFLSASAAKLVPPDDKIIFGAWLDTSSGPVSGNDSPSAFNKRIGFNTGSFQIWQNLPPQPPKQEADLGNHNADGTIKMSVFDDGTLASIFLTVYPLDLDFITDQHILDLANQCNGIKKTTNRDVFLRLGPEMNGDWFKYGGKPKAFISLWKRAHGIISKTAPEVPLIWSPNYNGPANKMPYDPYWPGEEYVDWIGISVYWKGFANLIDAQGPEGGPVSIYREYAVKYNKPLVIAESAGTFHLATLDAKTGELAALDRGAGREKTVMSFWNSFLFKPTFYNEFPLVKMIFCFEMVKTEDMDTVNDYRATHDPATLAAFVQGLNNLDGTGKVAWASSSTHSKREFKVEEYRR